MNLKRTRTAAWLFRIFFGATLGICLVCPRSTLAAEQNLQDSLARGRSLYMANCLICHQVTGLGTPGVFPPLAKSDFLTGERRRSILAVLEGMNGPITVNGRKYNGTMPPVNLTDQQVADVFTFVLNSWGNPGGTVSTEEVKEIRAQSKFPTYEALVAANSFAPLPEAPKGLSLREVLRLPEHAIRLVGDQKGEGMYVLGGNGNVWHLDPRTASFTQILWGKNYLPNKGNGVSTWGMTLDKAGRMYLVSNRRRPDTKPYVTNEVVIYRTTNLQNGHPSNPKPWFELDYPWGVGPFNHCVNHIALGPDGYLYVNSGSRTDGGEAGNDPDYWKGGELETTACIWRLNPEDETPKLEIYAHGLRNSFGFCWNDQGEMFATENGPDAHAAEELNLIEKGRHYGFPYTFADWKEKAYPYTPDAPAGLQLTLPIPNFGPDGGYKGKPIYTFDPHSSPAGIIYLGMDFPPPYAGSFLVARAGNLIKLEKDVGFDVLQVRIKKQGTESYAAEVHTLLAPLGRPIDLHANRKGQVYILEYSRPTDNAGALGFPGRVLELSVAR